MKYANTSRTLSFLAHALIVLAFGALGLYFGAFVVPEYFGTDPTYFTKNLFSGAYLLYSKTMSSLLVLLTKHCLRKAKPKCLMRPLQNS